MDAADSRVGVFAGRYENGRGIMMLFAEASRIESPNLYTVLLAFIAGLPALLTAIAGFCIAMSGRTVSKANSADLQEVKTAAVDAKAEANAAKIEAKEVRAEVKEVYKATNSMAQALIKETGESERAKGVLEGQLRRPATMPAPAAVPVDMTVETMEVDTLNAGEKKP